MQIYAGIFSKNPAIKIPLQILQKLSNYTLMILFKKIVYNISHINIGINYNRCTNLKRIHNNISRRKARIKLEVIGKRRLYKRLQRKKDELFGSHFRETS